MHKVIGQTVELAEDRNKIRWLKMETNNTFGLYKDMYKRKHT